MVHTISLLSASFTPNNLFRDAQLIKLQQLFHIYKLRTSHVHIFKVLLRSSHIYMFRSSPHVMQQGRKQ